MEPCTKLFVGADYINRYTGADVLYYNISTTAQRKQTVSCDKSLLSDGWCAVDPESVRYFSVVDAVVFDKCRILLMETYRHVKLCSILHGSVAESGICKRDAVIGKATCSGFL